MTWELERHDWGRLKAQGSAVDVPAALVALASATSEAEAREAYWRIDNTVVVQGTLHEAAVATTASAVAMLPGCNPSGRASLLELLVQLGAGEPAPTEEARLHDACVAELRAGMAIFVRLLEHGTPDEVCLCVDLLGICAREDAHLRPRVRWYFERLLATHPAEGLRNLVADWLQEL